ncbi:MAG: DNA-binding response OmpR family regulator [Verrucomicrobiales bacterium]|jgi:DNA-binding response OmpR family regulator
MQTILVIEDDRPIREGVVDALTFSGYAVLQAPDGAKGMELALAGSYDLVLLDLVLPHHSGFEILEKLQELRAGMPVIVLSARGEEADRVRGLKLGADDYVVKPFSVNELLARVEAVLRRTPARPEAVAKVSLPCGIANLEMSEIRFHDGGRTELSAREVDLLRYFAGRRGRAISRDEILRHVWRVDPRNIETRTIDMHIAHLRGKIRDNSSKPKVLLTVRGKGYMFAAEASP